jgi:hypothetical protein
MVDWVEILGWAAMLIGWLALYLSGRYRVGWLISALVWALWFPYGLFIHSVPVMINTTVYAVISFQHWRKWKVNHESIQNRIDD